MSNRTVYSTSTTTARMARTGRIGMNRVAAASRLGHLRCQISDPFCFLCGRATDHWGEHDDAVAAGRARYSDDGSVYPVPLAF